ncbi:MAG: hypothetical protein HQM10_24865 [Candidatus Riflebacteria bacterium]|nr:hypothetical protein [Candidatus Riflebacteria bacterium]
MILDKRENTRTDINNDIGIAFNILTYNQGLIQFADGKANALLLINSIFIASLAPFIDSSGKDFSKLATVAIFVFFIFSIVSILASLSVISTRKITELEKENNGNLVFFGEIVKSNNPEGYIHDFHSTGIRNFHESLLKNIFVISKIASSKYSMYGFAQMTTFTSCITWIINMVIIFGKF